MEVHYRRLKCNPGSVVQWKSLLPEDPGLNPARVEGFKGKHGNAVVNIDLM
jgi:hypothetical protein